MKMNPTQFYIGAFSRSNGGTCRRKTTALSAERWNYIRFNNEIRGQSFISLSWHFRIARIASSLRRSSHVKGLLRVETMREMNIIKLSSIASSVEIKSLPDMRKFIYFACLSTDESDRFFSLWWQSHRSDVLCREEHPKKRRVKANDGKRKQHSDR